MIGNKDQRHTADAAARSSKDLAGRSRLFYGRVYPGTFSDKVCHDALISHESDGERCIITGCTISGKARFIQVLMAVHAGSVN